MLIVKLECLKIATEIKMPSVHQVLWCDVRNQKLPYAAAGTLSWFSSFGEGCGKFEGGCPIEPGNSTPGYKVLRKFKHTCCRVSGGSLASSPRALGSGGKPCSHSLETGSNKLFP